MHLEDDEDEAKPTQTVKLPMSLLISQGNQYLRLLKFEKAISSFELVLQRNPTDVKALMGRAKCFMRLGKYKDAMQDFQRTIQLNPRCTEAIYLKGVTEYLKGNFEKSFETYWEGHKLRPDCDKLRQGHEMCKKAIKNNLGAAENSMVLTVEDVSRLLQVKDITEKCDSKSYECKGLFGHDLKNLEDMSKDKNLTSYHSLFNDAFDYLSDRQKFRKLQAPCVSRNRCKINISILPTINSLLRKFRTCKSALKDEKIDICIGKGTEILETLKNLSSEHFPEKREMEVGTLHYLGLVYFMIGDLASAIKYCENQLDIARNNDLRDVEGRVLRDMGEIYHKGNQYEKALSCFQQSLEFASSEKSGIMLLYKIADCSIHLNKLENAQKAATECLEFAAKSSDTRFHLDAMLLLAEIAVKGKNMLDARRYYSDALEVAVENQDARQMELESLLHIFEEVAGKESYSDERVKIVQITDVIKNCAA